MRSSVWTMVGMVALASVTAAAACRACPEAVAERSGLELLGFPSLAISQTIPPDPVDAVLAEAPADLQAVAESLVRATTDLRLLAEGLPSVTPHPASRTSPRPARPARPARAARATGHGWSYAAEQSEDEDAEREVRLDTIVVVRVGSKLTLENFGGTIDVKTWARNAVRVRAEHGPSSWVELTSVPGRVDIATSSRLGPPGAVDYELTLPHWMNVSLTGVYNDVTAEGLEGGMTVETVSGDIKVRRVAGEIALRSVQGMVIVEGAKGNLQLSSVNDGVRVVNAVGVIAAEAINGDIQLVDLDSKNVIATTVSGEVVYAGTILDDGAYRFSTHNGDIALGLSDAANATVSVATFNGEFESPYPVRIKHSEKGKRFRFVLGSGAARVNLESFDGAIQLFRPGEKGFHSMTLGEWLERQKERQTERQLERARAQFEKHQERHEKSDADDNDE